jgi:MoaA/NifB/PqqE/SkfB family radical SAM enzyme
MSYKLDSDLKYTHKAALRAKTLQVRNYTCTLPTQSVTVDGLGRVTICDCDGNLPWPVGLVKDFRSIEEIWETPVAKKLQQSTTSGSTFKFCDTARCGIKSNRSLPKFWISVNTDESCNLTCASCREQHIYHKIGTDTWAIKKDLTTHTMNLAREFYNPTIISLAGSGDCFASNIFSELLYTYIPNPNHTFMLMTNGLLLNKQRFDKSKIAQQLEKIYISIDAGTASTYEKVRSPGKWTKVIENLNYLKQNRMPVLLTFTVQANNVHDVPAFVDLANEYNMSALIYGVQDWGTWRDFQSQRVHCLGDNQYKSWEVYRKYALENNVILKGC